MSAVVENLSGDLSRSREENMRMVESEEESREFDSMNSSVMNVDDQIDEDELIDPDISDKEDNDGDSGNMKRSSQFPAVNSEVFLDYKLSPDTNKLLRDIIHDRERRLVNGQSPIAINGDHNAMVNQLLHERELYRNGELNLDMSVVSQGLSNSDESDGEMDKNQNKRSCSSPLISPGGSSSGQLSPSDPEALKVKRARVENIITFMRLSPSAPNKPDLANAPIEKRNNKRKQYQPQQHDVRLNDDDEPISKKNRTDKDNLKDQLKQMQQQLFDMQQKYIHLFEKTSAAGLDTVDSSVNVENLRKPSHCINDNGKETNNNNTNVDEKSKSSLPLLNLENKDIEPSHFIHQVCKLVSEQEVDVSKPSETVLPSKSGIEELAKSIKNEIKDVISSTVDAVVTKFLHDNKSRLMNNLSRSSPSPHHDVKSNVVVPSSLHHRVCTPNKIEHKPTKTKVTDKTPFRIPDLAIPNGFPDPTFHPLPAHHPFHPFPFFPPGLHHHSALFHPPKKEPEQTEALPLIVNTPKKKRTKVTDTRLSPRAARALLHDGSHEEKMMLHHLTHDGYPMIPVSLPTSVAIPNPSLQHSDIMSMHGNLEHHSAFHDVSRSPPMDHFSPNGHLSPHDCGGLTMPMMRKDHKDMYIDKQRCDSPTYEASMAHITTTLTPMHLRKAKLMFFFVRYPSSAILKVYFPDIKFNKNNTAQLVKWFSNFREFFYIQMEKYARQAIAEGVKSAEDLLVSLDCELYRVLNLHYNRNNQIEVPDSFGAVVQSTLREFYRSLVAGKDTEQSWKKSIYKVIARMDDPIPEFFKSPNWMEQLGEQ